MKQIPRSLIIAAGLADFDVRVAAHASEMRAWRAHMAMVTADEAADPPIHPRDRHAGYPAPAAHPLVAAAIDEEDRPSFEVVEDGPTPEQLLAAKKGLLLQAVAAAEQAAKAAVAPIGKRRLLALRENDIRRADAVLAGRLTEAHASAVAAAAARHAERLAEYVSAVQSDEAKHAARVAAAERAAADAKPPGRMAKAAVALRIVSPPEPAAPPVLAPPPPPPEMPAVPPPPDVAAELLAARPAEDTLLLDQQRLRRDRMAAIERAAAQAMHDVEDLTAETVDAWRTPNLNEASK